MVRVVDTPPAAAAGPAAGPAKRRNQGLDEMKQYFLRTRRTSSMLKKTQPPCQLNRSQDTTDAHQGGNGLFPVEFHDFPNLH